MEEVFLMQQEYVVRTTFIRVVIKVKWVFKMSTSDNKKMQREQSNLSLMKDAKLITISTSDKGLRGQP